MTVPALHFFTGNHAEGRERSSRMKHKRIRWLGAMLASAIAVTSLPMSALAAEPVEVIPTETIISNADNSMGGVSVILM